MKSKQLLLTAITALVLSLCGFGQQLDADGTRFYWMEDWSDGETYLEKFAESEWDQWQHAASRIDAYAFRRNSVPGLSAASGANNAKWQGFQEMVQNSEWIAAMNTGLPNKSWEYADRQVWINKFSGDLGIIRMAHDAGFTEIVMFMQSVLSKGQKPTFDPSVINDDQPNGGADLEQRVEDCLEYANYILENSVDGIEVKFALIDAFPIKNTFGNRAVYRAAYKDLVETFHDAGVPFVGFSFDIKSATIKNNPSILINDCKYIQQLEDELAYGEKIRKGWYTWSSWNLSQAQQDADVKAAMRAIDAHADKDYVEDIWIAGNGESGHYPDYINGNPTTRTERFNQIFCILEGLEDNPTQYGDPILVPTNSVDKATMESVRIYPNPSKNYFNIQLEMETQADIRIYNSNGQLAKSFQVKNKQVKVITTDFENGLYIIRINTDKGIGYHKVMIN